MGERLSRRPNQDLIDAAMGVFGDKPLAPDVSDPSQGIVRSRRRDVSANDPESGRTLRLSHMEAVEQELRHFLGLRIPKRPKTHRMVFLGEEGADYDQLLQLDLDTGELRYGNLPASNVFDNPRQEFTFGITMVETYG